MSQPTLLLASDLDGTIIFNRAIGAHDASALAAWRAAGHLAVCATGKSLDATQHALAGQGVTFDYYVLYTGAVVADGSYQILSEQHLPLALVREVLDFLSGIPNLGVYATTLGGPDRSLTSTLPAGAHTDIIQSFVPLSLDELDQHQFVGIPMWVSDTEEAIARLLGDLKATFGDRTDIHQNQDFLDIVPKGSTKAAGLNWLRGHLQESGRQVRLFTMGDSFNDVDMHAIADHSTSFPHSPPVVQQATTVVSGSAADYITALLAMHE